MNHLAFCWLDLAGEDYENAAAHLKLIDLSSVPDEESKLKLGLAIRLLTANTLAGLGQCDEAEKIYLQLLGDQNKTAVHVSTFENRTRTALAKMYLNGGEFSKAHDLLNTVEEYLSDAETEVATGSLRLDFEHATAKSKLVQGEHKSAAQRALIAVDLAQLRWGYESIKYVQSIELLASVRVAQARHYEAINCFEKARDVRSRMFGPEHPSVGRIEAEIKLIRSQSASAPMSIVLRGISECLDANPLKVAPSGSNLAPVATDTQTSVDPVSLGGGKVNLDSQDLLNILDKPILK